MLGLLKETTVNIHVWWQGFLTWLLEYGGCTDSYSVTRFDSSCETAWGLLCNQVPPVEEGICTFIISSLHRHMQAHIKHILFHDLWNISNFPRERTADFDRDANANAMFAEAYKWMIVGICVLALVGWVCFWIHLPLCGPWLFGNKFENLCQSTMVFNMTSNGLVAVSATKTNWNQVWWHGSLHMDFWIIQSNSAFQPISIVVDRHFWNHFCIWNISGFVW